MLVNYKFSAESDLLTVFGKKIYNKLNYILLGVRFLQYESIDEYRIIDNRDSAFWIMKNSEHAIPEWFEPYFYENLSNDAPRESFIVNCYRIFFEREYPSSLLITADSYGAGYLECPKCKTIFHTNSYFGVIRCSNHKCSNLMNNPYTNHAMICHSPEIAKLNVMHKYKNCYYYSLTKKYYTKIPDINGEGDLVL